MFPPFAPKAAPLPQRRLALVIAALLGNATLGAPAAIAAPAAVTSCADDGGFDTLRHAVLTSNSGDTIDLGAIGCSTITLSSAITINFAPLTIVGPGADKLTISTNDVDRVIINNSTSALTLTGLTITHGTQQTSAEAYGGCIYSKGTVTLQRSVVSHCTVKGKFNVKGGGIFTQMDVKAYGSTLSGNSASSSDGTQTTAGGAVFAAGTITLGDSIVSGNTATSASGSSYGGALMSTEITAKYSTISGNSAIGNAGNASNGGATRASGMTAIINCTVDHNTADIGGAISAIGTGPLGILQSTVSTNTANSGIGQAIASNVDTEIDNSTIAFNTGGPNALNSGVWIANISALTVKLQSSILADNSALDIDVFNPMQLSGSNNLVKLPGSGAKVPGGTLNLDPNLGPLAYNGGTMRTHAIDATSPAIGGGADPDDFLVDQRGPPYRRDVDTPDIGAFEFDADHIFGWRFETH